jgi:hypothetical protein
MSSKPSIKRWVHISEQGGNPWVLPIWVAAHSAFKSGRAKKITKRLRELGLHISIRLNLIPRVIRRIDEGVAAVNDTVAARPPGHESSATTEGYSLPIDDNLKYELLLDIDSLLFELKSLYELWEEFFKALHNHLKKQMPEKSANESIKKILISAGKNTTWIDELHRERLYFIHRGAPYLAVDVTRKKYDPVFLRSNVHDLSESEDFVRLSELKSMV